MLVTQEELLFLLVKQDASLRQHPDYLVYVFLVAVYLLSFFRQLGGLHRGEASLLGQARVLFRDFVCVLVSVQLVLLLGVQHFLEQVVLLVDVVSVAFVLLGHVLRQRYLSCLAGVSNHEVIQQ
ncbi:Hypothetical_protein [Hexamita inflata]|uniref:Hypothetical_protein n=1 Tax=Hexamita inflata TaxID=28002 RepID=A0AA86NP40_9EUKA|nr:Hypothetical protein HINF_LOCUS10534 [Hexamita inflata]